MHRSIRFLLAGLLTILALGLPDLVKASVLLDARFDDRTPATAIGTGGAAVGEPVAVDPTISATVIEAAPGSNYLRLQRTSGTTAAQVKFGFLDDIVVSSGLLHVGYQLRPSALDQYTVQLRASTEAASATQLTLNLSSNGSVYVVGGAGVITTFSYSAGDVMQVDVLFDLGANTHSLWVNGSSIYVDHATGSAAPVVGSFRVGYNSGGNGSVLELEDLHVEWSGPVGNAILDAGFTLQNSGTASARGVMFGEPFAYSGGLVAEIVNVGGMPDPALRFASEIVPLAQEQTLQWGFRDNLVIDSGTLNITMRLQMENEDDLQLRVRDAGGSVGNFSTLTFTAAGDILAGDAAGNIGMVGSFSNGQYLDIDYGFDLDTGLVSLWLDGSEVISSRSFGVGGMGIGQLVFAITPATNSGSATIIDDLLVTSSAQAPLAVSVAKTASPPSGSNVSTLQMMTYTVAVDIAGQPLSEPLVLRDTLDADSGFNGVLVNDGFSIDTAYSPATLSLPGGTAPGHYELSYMITVSGNANGTLDSMLEVLAGGGDITPVCDPCQTSHTVVAPVISVGKTATPPSGSAIMAGQAISFSIAVTVQDQPLSSPLMLQDSLGSGLAFDQITGSDPAFDANTSGNPLTFTLPAGIAVGEYVLSYRVLVDAAAQPGDPLGSQVLIVMTGGDSDAECNPCSTQHTVAGLAVFSDGFE